MLTDAQVQQFRSQYNLGPAAPAQNTPVSKGLPGAPQPQIGTGAAVNSAGKSVIPSNIAGPANPATEVRAPSQGAPGITPPSSTQQLPSWYTQLRTPTPSPQTAQPKAQPQKPGLLKRIGGAIGSVAHDVVTGDIVPDAVSGVGRRTIAGFKSGAQQAKEGAQQVGDSQDPLTFAEGSIKAGAGVVNSIFSPLGAAVSPVVEPIVNAAADKISDSPAVQKFANSKAGEITSRAAEDVGNLDTLAAVAVPGATPEEALSIADNAAGKLNTVIDKAGEVGAKVKDTVTPAVTAAKDVGSKVISKTVGEEALARDTAKIEANKAAKVDKATGQITQGDTTDLPKAQRALTQIDPKGVKTFSDLSGKIQDKLTQLKTLQDQAYDTRPEKINFDDMTHNNHNYVNDALTQLDEFYKKTNDVSNARRIEGLRTQAQTRGLSAKEINNLAREHGQTLNAYNANGELASGLTKQAAENTRQGLKDTVRGYIDNPALQGSDKQMSDLINTKDLIDRMNEKVNQLGSKIQQRGLLGKLGYGAGKVVDTLSGHFLKNLVNYFVPRGEGLKVMNPLDLQAALGKNLKVINKLLDGKMSNADFTSQLNDVIKQGNPQKLLSPPKAGVPKSQVNTPIDNYRTSDFEATKGSIKEVQNNQHSRVIRPVDKGSGRQPVTQIFADDGKPGRFDKKVGLPKSKK